MLDGAACSVARDRLCPPLDCTASTEVSYACTELCCSVQCPRGRGLDPPPLRTASPGMSYDRSHSVQPPWGWVMPIATPCSVHKVGLFLTTATCRVHKVGLCPPPLFTPSPGPNYACHCSRLHPWGQGMPTVARPHLPSAGSCPLLMCAASSGPRYTCQLFVQCRRGLGCAHRRS